MLEVDADQALAFRLAGHHLHRRTDPLTAVAACGLQEVAPDWWRVALRARSAHDVDPDDVVMVNAMRGAPWVVPRAAADVFTRALVPADDGALKALMSSAAAKEIVATGRTVREGLDAIADAAREVLAAGPLQLTPFHQALRERLPDDLLPWCEGCQSHHVRGSVWRALGPLGVTKMTARATFALADMPVRDLDEARAELARRFLRTHAPATPAQLAKWAQTAPAHAKALLAGIADEVDEVRYAGRPALVLAEDRERLEAPPRARGVRLLGGYDPYVAQPDREALVPDAALRKRLYPAIGKPGVVLRDGAIAGIWRARRRGGVLEITVEWLDGEVDLGAEAPAVAKARGCESAKIVA